MSSGPYGNSLSEGHWLRLGSDSRLTECLGRSTHVGMTLLLRDDAEKTFGRSHDRSGPNHERAGE